jgi:hypothetical protein
LAMAETGKELQPRAVTSRYPERDPRWDLDFDNDAEMTPGLPRLTAPFLD